MAPGFSLVEMLVVMGIIVLAIAMAVPTIRYMTGSKSEQAAQNAVQAMLARARTDAVALQTPQGVLFTIDTASDRVTMYQVIQSPTLPTDPPGVTYLDLTPDRDPLPLPAGVRAWTILDPCAVPGRIPPFGQYRYLGYNNLMTSGTSPYTGKAQTDKAVLGGVILFDSEGNLLVAQYGFRFAIGTAPTAMAGVLFSAVTRSSPPALPSGAPPIWPNANNIYLRSQTGMILVDKDAIQTIEGPQQQQQQQTTSGGSLDGNANAASAEPVIDGWLDQNTTPLLVNNYSGTLTRAE